MKGCSGEDISVRSGFSLEVVQESLNRLTGSLLVTRRGDQYRASSIEEFMITNRMKHDPLSDIIIENGIIRVKDPKTNESGSVAGGREE
jgi:hypothetical protein